MGKTFKAAHLIAIHHYPHKTKLTLDTQVSLAPSPVSLSVGPFGFPFCQHLWDLTKRRDDIAVANMAADMQMHMVADMAADE